MRILVATLSLLLLAVVSGCGSSAPAESDGQRAISDRIKGLDPQSNFGQVTLVGFKKTNGQLQEVFGVKCYKMECQCEIEFNHDCNWRGDLASHDDDSAVRFFDRNAVPKYNVRAGERKKFDTIVTFQKTENGWRADKY